MTDLIEQLANYASHFDRALGQNDPRPGSTGHTAETEPHEGVVIMLDVQARPERTDRPTDRSRRPWLRYTALAAAAIITVIVAVALFDGAEESSPVDVVDRPTGPDGPASTDEAGPQPPEFTIPVARAMVDEYFDALNSGELEAVLALFVEDATFSDTNTPTLRRPDWEPRLAWDLAMGETSTSIDCPEEPGEARDEAGGLRVAAIRCVFDSQDAFAQAAGEATPYTAVITVTPDGISDVREDYGEPDGADFGGEFEQWLRRAHPDVADDVYQLWGDTVEESVTNAERTIPYLEEWGAHLTENGCTYDEPSCGIDG